jgi:GT2 family glycosyltransferase
LKWFVDNVWPEVHERLPAMVLVVAGRGAPTGFGKALGSGGSVRFLGEVEEVESLIADATVFVNPVFGGSGVNMKLAQPARLGTPIVTTQFGSRGVEPLLDGLVVADSASDFVRSKVLSEAVRDVGAEKFVVQVRDTGGYDQAVASGREPGCSAPGLKTVRVIVVNYNSSRYVERLLGDFEEEQAGDNSVRVTVLDNDSDAVGECERLSVLAKAHGELVDLHFSESNLGFGAGVNRAIELANPDGEDLVWIVNPDMRIDAGALGLLREHLEAGVADVLCPTILDGSGDRIWFRGGSLDTRNVATEHVGYGRPMGMKRRHERPVARCSFLTGAAPFMTFQTWQRVGGYSPRYFMYFEDAEWSNRARLAGVRRGSVGDVLLLYGSKPQTLGA